MCHRLAEGRRPPRPTVLARPSDEAQLRKARGYLEAFGDRWRDPAAPDALHEEAARQIFERLDLWGSQLVAVHPREEHAWLLGRAAEKREDVVMVGASGLNPAVPKCRIVLPPTIRAALAAA